MVLLLTVCCSPILCQVAAVSFLVKVVSTTPLRTCVAPANSESKVPNISLGLDKSRTITKEKDLLANESRYLDDYND